MTIVQAGEEHKTSKRRRSLKTSKEVKMQLALGTLEMDDVLKALRSKVTKGDVIEALYEAQIEGDEWDQTRKNEFISKHPNTPASVLVSIFKQKHFMEYPELIGSEYASILTHPNFPVKLLRDISNKIKYDSHLCKSKTAQWSYLFMAIVNPNFPVECLKDLSTHNNVCVRAEIAGHPNTPAETLEQLSTDGGSGWATGCWRPKERVAENKNAPPHVLAALAKDTCRKVRKKVAQNLNTPIETLKAMVESDKSRTIKVTALYSLSGLGQLKYVVD